MSPRGRLAVNLAALGTALLGIAGLTAATLVTGHREPPSQAERIAALTWEDEDLRQLLPDSGRLAALAVGRTGAEATEFARYDLATDVIPSTVAPQECTSLLWPQPAATEVLGGSASAFVDDSTFTRVTATASLYATPGTGVAAFEALVEGYSECDVYSYRQVRSPLVDYTWTHDATLEETSVGIPVLRIESDMKYWIEDTFYRQLVSTSLFAVGDAIVAVSVARFPDTDALVPLAEMTSVESRLEGAVLAELERAEADG